jgi:hypothetical protein
MACRAILACDMPSAPACSASSQTAMVLLLFCSPHRDPPARLASSRNMSAAIVLLLPIDPWSAPRVQQQPAADAPPKWKRHSSAFRDTARENALATGGDDAVPLAGRRSHGQADDWLRQKRGRGPGGLAFSGPVELSIRRTAPAQETAGSHPSGNRRRYGCRGTPRSDARSQAHLAVVRTGGRRRAD